MDAILFSANPNMVTVDDAVRHLSDHDELYWEVGFVISKKTADSFPFPIVGYMHISGGQVEYRVSIKEILPFTPEHYENRELASDVKPAPWIQEWGENINNVRDRRWNTILVITRIEPFSRDTYTFKKVDDSLITHPPQGFVRVLIPGNNIEVSALQSSTVKSTLPTSRPIRNHSVLAERNLGDIIIHQLDEIEPGLHLVKKQLSTAAGRLDLLCMDSEGNYVVVELKRDQGTDRVVGQILRYMGWVKVNHNTSRVRGIIIVAKKDPALIFALEAASNIQVKEFKLSIN